jgi:hypothetical protein
VLKQSQPRCLDHIGGVALHQLELYRDGPDQPGKLIDQALPRLMIPGGSAAHQARDARFEILS